MTVYKSIDIMKFIMALFVVTIHCYIIEKIQIDFLNRICTSIIYSAVPFFIPHLHTYNLDTSNIQTKELLIKVYSLQS